jgi:hypothetical protein
MRLNITFIIQICNFWITYFFLKKLLLKPLVMILNRREKTRQHIIDILKQKELFLKHKVEEKNKALLDFQLSLKKKYTLAPVEYLNIPLEFTYQKNKGEIDALILVCKNTLIEKVPHAYRQ